MNKIITKTFEETQKIGSQFAKKLKHGGVIALYGNLGSGKTTFVQGFAKGLGISNKIISPTFIIVRHYVIPDSGREDPVDSRSSSLTIRPRAHGREGLRADGLRGNDKIDSLKSFYHIDLYRIENDNDLKSLGLDEIINDPTNIVAIEWPEKIENLLPKKRINLYFEYLLDDKRKIQSEKTQ